MKQESILILVDANHLHQITRVYSELGLIVEIYSDLVDYFTPVSKTAAFALSSDMLNIF